MYTLRGTATNNMAIPKTDSTGDVKGPYTTPPVATGASAGPASAAGIKFSPSATPHVYWGAGFCDSGGTSADLNPNKRLVPNENAYVSAVVLHPASYTFSNFSGPGVTLSLILDKGLLLAARGDATTFISSEIKGTYATSLLSGGGFLWSFDWKAGSRHLDSSTFSFKSNPSLGLDDTAIQDAFLNSGGLTESNGVHQVTSPYSVSATLPVSPDMIASDGSLTYMLGRTVEYTAAGITVAEPNSAVVFCIALALCCLHRLAQLASLLSHGKRAIAHTR
jgi:hypothetical protein